MSVRNVNLQLFKKLRMSDATSSHEKFVKRYLAPSSKKIVIGFLKLFFENVSEDIATAVVDAYRMSAYSDEVFGIYCSLGDKKLRMAANKTVAHIETIIGNHHKMDDDKYVSKFCQCMDYYYSLYKVWSSRESLDKISRLCDSFDESDENSEETFIEQIEKMVDCDLKYSVKLLLDNYQILKKHAQSKEKFWHLVYVNYTASSDVLFMVFVSSIKAKMIKKTDQVQIKKELMYEIDVDAILVSIQNQTFTIEQQKNIVIKLETIMCSIDSSYMCSPDLHNCDKFNQKYVRCLVKTFEHLSDAACG